MSQFRSLADIRRDYGELSLDEDSIQVDPLIQFKLWFEDVLNNEKNDPGAMVLSTIDDQGHPDSRVVLLKGLSDEHFIFYTNYQSEKARQIELHPYAALNFYWPQMSRQVRIRGSIKKTDQTDSEHYFYSRPIKSQISAIISPQSQEISSRGILEKAFNDLIDLIQKNEHAPLVRPEHWGGYKVLPVEFEFWQGRDNRLHDRIQYYRQGQEWLHRRLAP